MTLLGNASPVAAHPRVLSTEPPADARVPTAPREIRIMFDKALSARGTQVQVYDQDRRLLPVRSVEVTGRGLILQARLDPPPSGTYTIA